MRPFFNTEPPIGGSLVVDAAHLGLIRAVSQARRVNATPPTCPTQETVTQCPLLKYPRMDTLCKSLWCHCGFSWACALVCTCECRPLLAAWLSTPYGTQTVKRTAKSTPAMWTIGTCCSLSIRPSVCFLWNRVQALLGSCFIYEV